MSRRGDEKGATRMPVTCFIAGIFLLSTGLFLLLVGLVMSAMARGFALPVDLYNSLWNGNESLFIKILL